MQWWRLPSLKAAGWFIRYSLAMAEDSFRNPLVGNHYTSYSLFFKLWNRSGGGMNETDALVPQPLGGLEQKKTGKDSPKKGP